ncbi:MAG TPA: emopamil-binding family protein [Spirochaetia bacterium]|nr:emopamil-binding family protein [Spirochaetia bacterium]
MIQTLPLRKRPVDIAVLAYFVFNLLFITYLFDLEQIVIVNAAHFTYPPWPPRFIVDLSHWWGRTFDPLLFARPVWWRATIWIDAILFGPFYGFAIYAFIRGRNWIRIPAVIYSSVMLTNVIIIMSEEIWGPHATSHLGAVAGANATWVIVPIYLIVRMWKSSEPFAGTAQSFVRGDK